MGSRICYRVHDGITRYFLKRVLSLLLILAPASVFAICEHTSFDHQIRSATVIAAGTVDHISQAQTSGMAATRYRFRDLRIIKGLNRDSLVLVQPGSPRVLMTPSVHFTLGKRYVVMVVSNGEGDNVFTSSPCSFWHPFRVEPETGSSTPIVRTKKGHSIAAVDSNHIVVAFNQAHVGANLHDPWSPVDIPVLIRSSDSTQDADLRLRGVEPSLEFTREVLVPWNKDPRIRMTEDEFVAALKGLVSRIHRRSRN